MPNRILKESITTSDTLPRVSLPAECLFYRLIVRVDDFGRYHGEPSLIYAHCMGNRIGQVSIEDVEAWLGELEAAGLVGRYEVGGRPYVELVTFDQHNQRRAAKSKFPGPPDGMQPRIYMPPSEGDGGQPPEGDDKAVKATPETNANQSLAGASNCLQVQADANTCLQVQANADNCEQTQATASKCPRIRSRIRIRSRSRSRSSTSPRARTREGAAAAVDNLKTDDDGPRTPEESAFAQVVKTYLGTFGKFPSAIIREDLGTWTDTLGAELVTEAIYRTAKANVRNWSYTEAILRAWRDANVQNLADVARADEEFAASKARNSGLSPPVAGEERTKRLVIVDPEERRRIDAEFAAAMKHAEEAMAHVGLVTDDSH